MARPPANVDFKLFGRAMTGRLREAVKTARSDSRINHRPEGRC